jgi:DNA-directed RNA polymerase sigma subunit (sigma70/sigma32)
MSTELVRETIRSFRKSEYFVTQQMIADASGLSRARIAQLERQALRKMARHPIMRQLAADAGIVDEGEVL